MLKTNVYHQSSGYLNFITEARFIIAVPKFKTFA